MIDKVFFEFVAPVIVVLTSICAQHRQQCNLACIPKLGHLVRNWPSWRDREDGEAGMLDTLVVRMGHPVGQCAGLGRIGQMHSRPPGPGPSPFTAHPRCDVDEPGAQIQFVDCGLPESW